MQPSEEHRLPVFEADDLRFDTQQQQVFLKGDRIAIPGKSMKLLQVLMEQAPQVLSKDQLFELVWDGRAVSESVLTTAVKELRKSLGDTARSPVYIQTVHGRGYRFLPAVAEEGKAAPTAEDQRLSPQAADSADAGHPTVAPRVSHSHQLVALLLVLAMAITAFLLATRSDDQLDNRQLAIAVLPFDDLSPTQDQSWFAIGLMEEMVDKLARLPRIRVSGRSNTLAMVERGLSPAEIATALDVDYILEGSVRFGEDNIKISSHLVDMTDASQVWAQTYDRSREDALLVQENIANAVAAAMGIAMDPDARAEMIATGTQSPKAYEAYLKGLANEVAHQRTGQLELDTETIAFFEQALSHDPKFCEAHTRLAEIHLQKLQTIRIGTNDSPQEYQARRKKFLFHIDEAINLSHGGTERTLMEANKSLITLEYRKQIRLLEDYLTHKPNDVWALTLLSEAGIIIGDNELSVKAVADMWPAINEKLAQNLVPDSIGISKATHAGAPELGIEISEAILDVFPEHAYALHSYHRALLAAGMKAKARSVLPRVKASGLPAINKQLATMRQECAEGRRQDALALLPSIADLTETTGATTPLWLAYMIVGQQEKADKLLEPMNTPERLPQLAGFLGYPHFDPSKYDQLQAIMVRENIPPRVLIFPPYSCPVE